jgi:hypothetical protein
MGTQNPEHPWWHITAVVAERLIGFGKPLLPEQRVALCTPPSLQGARWNPIGVATGELEVGITTPSATALMANDGSGVYDRSYGGLRAIAVYPHDDFLVFMIDADVGVGSLEELVERRVPIRLVTGRKSTEGSDDVLTFVVEEILRGYGADYAAIESWGGEVHYGGPTHAGGRLMLDGTANALFQEAQMTSVWHEIAASRAVRFLEVSAEVQRRMSRFGLGPRTIPAGHYNGLDASVPTVDFSGWLLFCREDLPYDQAWALAQACDETASAVEAGGPRVQRSLVLPIDPASLFRSTSIPLHEGAAAYARNRGYLGEP